MSPMRWSLAALATLAVVGAPAIASDQRAATLEAAITPLPSGSTAVDLHMTWADPGEPNAKPKQVKALRLGFPPGTRIDTAGLQRCTATDAQVRAKGPSACPRASRLGSGKSLATTGLAQIHADVVLINARRQIIVVVLVGKSVFAVYRDTVTRSTVTVNFALPAVVSVLDLRIHIPAHTRAGHRYFTAPPTCAPDGTWPMTATSAYADGTAQTATAAVACGSREPLRQAGPS